MITRALTLILLSIGLWGCYSVDSKITVTLDGAGTVTDDKELNCPDQCEATYSHSTNKSHRVKITAFPDPGYDFFWWNQPNGSYNRCGANPECNVSLIATCIGMVSPTCQGWAGAHDRQEAIFIEQGSIIDSDRDFVACLIHRSGELNCWPTAFDAEKPQVINPTLVDVGGISSGCVLDDSGLQCWGDRSISPAPKIYAPDFFEVDRFLGCAYEEEESICWSNYIDAIIIDGPKLEGITAYNLSDADKGFCAEHAEGTTCWSGRSRIDHIPANTPAELFAINDKNTCSYTANGGVQCWGEFQPSDPPLTNTATNLGISWNHLCTSNDRGTSCWKDGHSINLPDTIALSNQFVQSGNQICTTDNAGVICAMLESDQGAYRVAYGTPIDIAINQRGGCILEAQSISCWGDKHFWPGQLPHPITTTVESPTSIAVHNSALCVGGASGIECFSENGRLTSPPDDLSNITEIALGANAGCAIHEGKVSCWGHPNITTEYRNLDHLINPRNIQVGFNHACAIDDNGLQCWGSINRG